MGRLDELSSDSDDLWDLNDDGPEPDSPPKRTAKPKPRARKPLQQKPASQSRQPPP